MRDHITQEKSVWWTIVKTSKLEIEGRVEGGHIGAQDAIDFLFNPNLHSIGGKRGDERVVRSCLRMMGVWAAICLTPWEDSH